MEREQKVVILDENILRKNVCYYSYAAEPLLGDSDPRFPHAGDGIRAQGHILPDQLYEIARWKSPRRAALVYNNSAPRIREVTTEALALMETDPGGAAQTLDKLRGLGIRTASAVLAVVDPQNFGIIDVRVWKMLRRWQPDRFPSKSDGYWPVKYYLCCLEAMREIAQATGLTCREVDMALWQMDKEWPDQGGTSQC